MRVRVWKAKRELALADAEGRVVFRASVALGWAPLGPKQREGDGKTPEGTYAICLVKANGKFGPSLGLSYPSAIDGDRALQEGRITPETHTAIQEAHRQNRRPPWGTALGGEIYIHGGGTQGDWTQGCIALEDEDMARLFALAQAGDSVEILP